jgi:hypothetical protein
MDCSTISGAQSEPLKLLSVSSLPENEMGVSIKGESSWVVVGGSWDWGGEARLLMVDVHDPLNLLQVDALVITYGHNN